jgi:hypothetical protein
MPGQKNSPELRKHKNCQYITSSTSDNQKKAQTLRIKDEIKFLHKKKEKLNHELYKIHLQTAQQWGNTWHIIHDSILNSINKEIEKKYKSIEDKINRLTLKETNKPNTSTQFYPGVVNESAIKFSDEEMTLLNKGLKCNLSHKRIQWLSNLALEAKNAIILLPTQEKNYLRYQVAHNLQIQGVRKRLYPF